MPVRVSWSARVVPSFRALMPENSPGVTTIEMSAGFWNPASGLPPGPTSRAVGRGARLELDDDRLAAGQLARDVDGRAQLALRFKKRHGNLGIGIEPVQLEPAVACDAVVIAAPFSEQGTG